MFNHTARRGKRLTDVTSIRIVRRPLIRISLIWLFIFVRTRITTMRMATAGMNDGTASVAFNRRLTAVIVAGRHVHPSRRMPESDHAAQNARQEGSNQRSHRRRSYFKRIGELRNGPTKDHRVQYDRS